MRRGRRRPTAAAGGRRARTRRARGRRRPWPRPPRGRLEEALDVLAAMTKALQEAAPEREEPLEVPSSKAPLRRKARSSLTSARSSGASACATLFKSPSRTDASICEMPVTRQKSLREKSLAATRRKRAQLVWRGSRSAPTRLVRSGRAASCNSVQPAPVMPKKRFSPGILSSRRSSSRGSSRITVNCRGERMLRGRVSAEAREAAIAVEIPGIQPVPKATLPSGQRAQAEQTAYEIPPAAARSDLPTSRPAPNGKGPQPTLEPPRALPFLR